MMNHQVEIISKWGDDPLLDRRAHRLFKQMCATHGAFTNHHSFRIDEVDEIGDAKAEIVTHLFKYSAIATISCFRLPYDLFEKRDSRLIIQFSRRQPEPGALSFSQNSETGRVRFHATVLAALTNRPAEHDFGVPKFCPNSAGATE